MKTPFLEHLCTMTSIEKDSIAATPDSFKDCILACKISNQVNTDFEKRKVPQAASGNFVQKWLFLRHMFCTIFASLSVAKILENLVWSSSYLL